MFASASKETAYNPADDSQITIIKAGDVKETYKNLDEALSQLAFFEPIPLMNYEPQDHFSCRSRFSNLTLSSCIALYRMLYVSNFGTINFAWKLPESETVNDYESSHAKALLIVTQQLPLFYSDA